MYEPAGRHQSHHRAVYDVICRIRALRKSLSTDADRVRPLRRGRSGAGDRAVLFGQNDRFQGPGGIAGRSGASIHAHSQSRFQKAYITAADNAMDAPTMTANDQGDV